LGDRSCTYSRPAGFLLIASFAPHISHSGISIVYQDAVIADAMRIPALAGVYNGEISAIKKITRQVVKLLGGRSARLFVENVVLHKAGADTIA